jgi:hypothetical protein
MQTITLTVEQLRRYEETQLALRKRNGELLEALRINAPTDYDALLPISDLPTSYKVIEGIHNNAIQLANDPTDEYALEALTEAITVQKDYWEETARETERRSWAGSLKNLKKRYKAGEKIAQDAEALASLCRTRSAEHVEETNLALGG